MPRKLKKKQNQELATTDRLLDTAERLFAEHGFDGVGMRVLAGEAGVNLGATTYHYGSKEQLYIETFMRRFRPANAARLELLRQAEAAANGGPVPVETIVDCMMRPPFLTVVAHPHFPALLARNLFMPPPFLRGVLEKELEPNMRCFVAALSRALPKLPPEVLQMRVMFAGGALLMFAGQMSKLPIRDTAALCEGALKSLVRFVSAGLRAEPEAIDKGFRSLKFGPLPSRG